MEDQYGATPTASLTAAREWDLEALGNWKGFREDDDSTLDWDVLDQTRLHNEVNEIDDDNDHLPGDPINEGAITETQGDSWVVPGYDAAGNMLSGPKPGNETVRQHCKWDAWNRLVAVYADDDGEPGDLVATYRYDGLNRRIQKVVEGSPDVTYDYYYNESWQIVEVRKDSDTDPLEQYVWDIRYIDAPVVRFRDGNTDGDLTGGTQEGDNTLYYTNDANMNVTALVDASDGAVVERYMYDPYGKPTVLNGVRDSTGTATTEWNIRGATNTFQNAILYCGYFFDDESGLYSVRRRYYHPPLGRLITRDRDYYDGMSLYEYVGTRPISRADALGLWAGSDHEEITTDAFNDIKGRLFPRSTEALDWMLKTLVDHNNAIDSWFTWGQIFGGLGFYQQEWHYLSPTEDRKEEYRRKYKAVIKQTRDKITELVEDAEKIPDFLRRGPPCKRALERIGNLDHAMQDFYAHATLRPPPKTPGEMPDVNSEAAFGVMSSFPGWVAWSVGVASTPEQPEPTWPGTFFIAAQKLFEQSEHSWTSEPAGAGCEAEARLGAAGRFQKEVYSATAKKYSVIYWAKPDVCGCWVELEHRR